MAGLRASVVVIITSFLLGCLFTHWTADYLTLWKSPVTDEHLWSSAAYYHVLTHMSTNSAYGLAAAIATGAITILWSLGDGEAGNIMFDGASIFLYLTAVYVYTRSVFPSLLDNFTALKLPETIPEAKFVAAKQFPQHLKEPTLDIASSHLVCAVALTGVMILQAGRWFVQQKDVDVDDEPVEPDTTPASPK